MNLLQRALRLCPFASSFASPFVSSVALALLGLAASTQTAQACAACGCSLSSDWEHPGLSSDSHFQLDLRYDQLNQNQLRSGSARISSAAASQIVHDGDAQEVERYTRNHYVTLGLDAALSPDWGLNAQLPYIVRSHSTLGTASDGSTPGNDAYDSRTASLGDVKLTGRYQGLLPERHLALLFGLKLPTGSHTRTGTSTDPAVTDPVAIDPGLQPGTGTTDLILGATWVGALNADWRYMVQGLFQSALNTRDAYRPGKGLNLNAGVRYSALASVQPQLQLNIRHAVRDSGANADTVSTGGTLAYLSPGLNVPLSPQAAVYAYAQLPIFQHVNGVQLVPRASASVGLRYAF